MRYICTSIVAIASLGITGTSLGDFWTDYIELPVTVSELNGDIHDYFGTSVAIDGDTCVIGAFNANNGNGGAFVYTSDASGNWSQAAAFAYDSNYYGWGGGFGNHVAIDGDVCVIGAPWADESGGESGCNGCVFIYKSDAGGNWSWAGESCSWTCSELGTSVAIDGDTCVIGAPGTNSVTGSAHILTPDANGNWYETAIVLTASNGASGDRFGFSIAIDGDTCVIGAPGTNSQTGSAYVFTSDGSGNWSQVAELNGQASGDRFGESVDIDGDTCVIGTTAANSYTGSAYIFTSDGSGNWSQIAEFNGQASGEGFGVSVAIDGDNCIIGAPGPWNPPGAGSAYRFTSDASGNWSQVAELNGQEASSDKFGSSVAIDGDTCVIGAIGTNSYAGSAYIHKRDAYGYAEPTGACCLNNGCMQGTEADCTTAGGTYAGDDVACADAGCPTAPGTGACCMSSVCFNATGTQCTSIGGTYAGDDIACADAGCPTAPATGACCVGSSCFDATSTQCTEIDGTWLGEGGSCDDCTYCPPTDINTSGQVNIDDLLLVIEDWGETCTP